MMLVDRLMMSARAKRLILFNAFISALATAPRFLEAIIFSTAAHISRRCHTIIPVLLEQPMLCISSIHELFARAMISFRAHFFLMRELMLMLGSRFSI